MFPCKYIFIKLQLLDTVLKWEIQMNVPAGTRSVTPSLAFFVFLFCQTFNQEIPTPTQQPLTISKLCFLSICHFPSKCRCLQINDCALWCSWIQDSTLFLKVYPSHLLASSSPCHIFWSQLALAYGMSSSPAEGAPWDKLGSSLCASSYTRGLTLHRLRSGSSSYTRGLRHCTDSDLAFWGEGVLFQWQGKPGSLVRTALGSQFAGCHVSVSWHGR